MRHNFKFLAVFLALLLVGAACGGDDDDAGAGTDTTGTATTDGDGDTGDDGGDTDGGPTEEAVVKIGSLHSLTGAFSALGIANAGGVNVAVAELNEAGGIVIDDTRYTFEVVEGDVESDPATATTVAQEVVRDEGVKFLFGPSETPTATNVRVVAGENDVMYFTSSFGLADSLSEEGVDSDLNEHLFATGGSASDSYVAGVEGTLQINPDIETAAILFPSGASMDPLTQIVDDGYTERGVEVVETLRFDSETSDFTPLLTRLKGRDIDVVFTGTSPDPIATIAQQMVEVGDVADMLFGSGGQANIGLTGNNGEPLPFPFGYYTPGGADPNADVPGVQQFMDAYVEVNGEEPVAPGFAPFYYAPVLLLAKAMEQAGTVDDVDAITQALLEVSAEGPAGEVRYNELHRAEVPTAVCVVENAEVECVIVPFQG